MHSSKDFGFLTKRIEKPERQNRWFKIGAMLTVLIVGSLVLIAARPANVQTAERFEHLCGFGSSLRLYEKLAPVFVHAKTRRDTKRAKKNQSQTSQVCFITLRFISLSG